MHATLPRIGSRPLSTISLSAISAATLIGSQPVSPWTGALAPDLTRIAETVLTPVSVTGKGGGKYVVDLGKVYAGVPCITFSGGVSGTTVNMVGGYALNASGGIDTSQNQSTTMTYYSVLNGPQFYLPAGRVSGDALFRDFQRADGRDDREFQVRRAT